MIFFLFEKDQFPLGVGVRDISPSGKFIEIAPGYSGVVTGLFNGEYLFIGDQQPFQTV